MKRRRLFSQYGLGDGRQRREIEDLPRDELLRAVNMFAAEASDDRLREFLKNIIDDASLLLAKQKVERMRTQGIRHNFLIDLASSMAVISAEGVMNGWGEEVMTRLAMIWEKRADLTFQRIVEHFIADANAGEDGMGLRDRLEMWEGLVRDKKPLPFEGIITEITDSGMVINRIEKAYRRLDE